MLKENRDILAWGFRFLDILLISAAFWASYFMRFSQEGWELYKVKLEFQVFFLAQLISWVVFSQRFRLYVSKRFTDILTEILDVIKTISFSFMLGLIPAFFFREDPVSRLFLIYLWFIETSCLIGVRYTVRSILKYVRLRGYNYRQILIVGRNKRSEAIQTKILSMPEYGVRILGFVDAHSSIPSDLFSSHKFIGRLDELEKILRKNVIDEIIVTLPIKSFYQEICEIIRLCELTGVEIKIPTDLFNCQTAKSKISRFHGFEVIDFFTSPKINLQLIIKRLIDVIVSALVIVILSPLFIAIYIIIKLTSAGPAFFCQKRVGYNGRLFVCYKFRTMVSNAEMLKSNLIGQNEMKGPVFKIKNDPRVTKIGKFLRKTSLDELPQFINVLKGDMSLVGPRPPIPDEVCQYECQDLRRLSMRPGITCIWQISGRNNIPFEHWMKLDQQYIDHWSLWLDLKILMKTILAILSQKGAC